MSITQTYSNPKYRRSSKIEGATPADYDAAVDAIAANWKFPVRGNRQAPILVLCDATILDAAKRSLPMELELHQMWAKMAIQHGFVENDFCFMGISAPIRKQDENSAKKRWEWVSQWQQQVRALVKTYNPKFIVTLGNNPLRMVANKSVAVTKARGRFHQFDWKDPETGEPFFSGRYFPMLPPKQISIQPDNRPIMDADLGTLARVKQADWDISILADGDTEYEWCFDLQHLIDNPPKAISVDTEATGLNPLAEDFRVITVQISTRAGHSYVCRVLKDYFPDHPLFKDQGPEQILRLRNQIKQLLENPDIVKIFQNGKYDFKAFRSMGIEVCGWDWDTELMARFVNENFMTYGLDDLIKIYVPVMSGYADQFNQEIDKSRMIDVEPEKMLPYAGGDTDATFRLAQTLSPMLKKDPANLKVMRKVHMRGLLVFTKTVETHGFTFDTTALQEFQNDLETWIRAETRELVRRVPAAVRRKYLSDPKGFKFSRAECVIDTLFGSYDAQGNFHKGDGFGLKPKVFTDGTANEHDPSKRIPSTSTKQHLPYFASIGGPAQTFVEKYIELAKATKMLDTYAKGFWNVLKTGENGKVCIIPQYNFRTNTKRSNSTDPNGQNFPKRGQFAKAFRRLITASPGKVLVASDLSQAELRIAAWMANEREMLRIYREDGDIHSESAAMVMGLTMMEFFAQERGIRGQKRFEAKAVNFGFIYGAMASTFQAYAKTNYGVDFTLKEAEAIRDRFFEKFPDLIPWHERTKALAHEHGVVHSLHGLTRHLPSIYSTDWKVMTGAERNAVNSPVQNFGSDLGIIAMSRLASQADPNIIRPIGFIHDQLIAEVDEGNEVFGMGCLKWVMENPPLEEWFGITPPLPIKSDPEWGLNLADSTELGDAEQSIQDAVAAQTTKPEWWDDDEERAWARYRADDGVPEYTIRDVVGESLLVHNLLENG